MHRLVEREVKPKENMEFNTFYILSTSKVITGQVTPIYGNAYSYRLYSAALMGDQATGTMTWCAIHSSPYSSTKLTSLLPILVLLSDRLGSKKYHFCLAREKIRTPDLPYRERALLPLLLRRLVMGRIRYRQHP